MAKPATNIDLFATHPLLSDRVRLAIMGSLAASDEPIEFNVLLNSLGLSKGNLSSHMRRLEDAKLIEIKKEFVGRKPKTTYKTTDHGDQALKEYLDQMQKLLQMTQNK